MKLILQIALPWCAAALFAAPASACFLFPFGGWWGAGYYGAPAYAAPSYSSYYAAPSYTSFYGAPSHTSYYGSFSSPSYGCCENPAPVYSASYGSFDGGCCANSCCQPCCTDSCGSGCASSSCVGTTPSGTLKPTHDPMSDRKAPGYEEETRPRRFPDSRSPRTPAGGDDLIDPVNDKDRYDPFKRPGEEESEPATRGTSGGSGSDPPMFNDGIDPKIERSNQKPELPDVLDDKESEPANPTESELGSPVDGKTFFNGESKPDNTTSRPSDAVIARSSSLSEVITPKRLASRSLPFNYRSAARSTLADKSNNTKSDSARPLRWIAAPLPDGHVQL